MNQRVAENVDYWYRVFHWTARVCFLAAGLLFLSENTGCVWIGYGIFAISVILLSLDAREVKRHVKKMVITYMAHELFEAHEETTLTQQELDAIQKDAKKSYVEEVVLISFALVFLALMTVSIGYSETAQYRDGIIMGMLNGLVWSTLVAFFIFYEPIQAKLASVAKSNMLYNRNEALRKRLITKYQEELSKE